MRIVLDTNVIVSAVLFGGNPRRVIEAVLAGRHRLVTSGAILDEAAAVLSGDKFRLPAEYAERVRLELLEIADMVAPKRRLRVVRRDPSDDRVIECAVEGEADFIISGDKDLLDLKAYRGIGILSPAEFLKR